MSTDYITIGSTPCEEECAQVGCEDYRRKAMDEGKRFIRDIRLKLGPEPEGARLTIRGFPHDFGTYYEVCCIFEVENEEATAYALRCEAEAPEVWSKEPWPEPTHDHPEERFDPTRCEACAWDQRRKLWEQETGRPHPMSLGAVLNGGGILAARVRASYDVIQLADDEWGNQKMNEVAKAYFEEHPDVQFVRVCEHAGWWLGYRRDMTRWGTANDQAVLEKAEPRPVDYSGVSVNRNDKKEV